MAASKIEWTDETWNPVIGCTKISPGCAHCYAETMAARLKAMALADIAAGKDPGRKRYYIDAIDDKGRWSGKLIPVPEALEDPSGWRKPRFVFVNSMSDLFHESVPETFIAEVFQAMRRNYKHTYQVLTKRAERMHSILSKWRQCEAGWITHNGANPSAYGGDGIIVGEPPNGIGLQPGDWPPPNVWLGVSVERQQEADERIPWLLKTPAAVRFLSCEPLLGAVDLAKSWPAQFASDRCRFFDSVDSLNVGGKEYPKRSINWVIVGGESGHDARPMDIAWARAIVEQCKAADVACFVKQLGQKPFDGDLIVSADEGNALELSAKKGGDMSEWPEDLRVREYPTAVTA